MAGDTRSLVGMALAKLDREGTEYDPKAAQALLEKAVAAGDPDAKYRLAKVLEGGIGVEPDLARALTLYEAAAEAKIPAALNDMGYFYFTGRSWPAQGPRQGAGAVPRGGGPGSLGSVVQRRALCGQWTFARSWPEGCSRPAVSRAAGRQRQGAECAIGERRQIPKRDWAGLQAILAENGLYDGAVDGSFGREPVGPFWPPMEFSKRRIEMKTLVASCFLALGLFVLMPAGAAHAQCYAEDDGESFVVDCPVVTGGGPISGSPGEGINSGVTKEDRQDPARCQQDLRTRDRPALPDRLPADLLPARGRPASRDRGLPAGEAGHA